MDSNKGGEGKEGTHGDGRNENILEDLLLEEKLAIVRVPASTCKLLLERNCAAGQVTPSMIRNHFRVVTTNSEKSHPVIDESNPQRVENAKFLLRYCCQDVDNTTFEQLLGLETFFIFLRICLLKTTIL